MKIMKEKLCNAYMEKIKHPKALKKNKTSHIDEEDNLEAAREEKIMQ